VIAMRATMSKSEQMRRVRTRGTAIEGKLRMQLNELGVRYRLNFGSLPGSPDIYIPRLRLALFANGCFWHGHTCRKGQTRPKTNCEFWESKITNNVHETRLRELTLGYLDTLALPFGNARRLTWPQLFAGSRMNIIDTANDPPR
jgi:DNA mismatch endonuclease Vsr